jgi:ABC-type uncharacterized transport system substrate-binding protein
MTDDAAFMAMARERAKASIVLSNNILFGQRKQIARVAAQKRLPGIAWDREFAEDGGLLMVYGPDVTDMHRRAAAYVDRVLGGPSLPTSPSSSPPSSSW